MFGFLKSKRQLAPASTLNLAEEALAPSPPKQRSWSDYDDKEFHEEVMRRVKAATKAIQEDPENFEKTLAYLENRDPDFVAERERREEAFFAEMDLRQNHVPPAHENPAVVEQSEAFCLELGRSIGQKGFIEGQSDAFETGSNLLDEHFKQIGLSEHFDYAVRQRLEEVYDSGINEVKRAHAAQVEATYQQKKSNIEAKLGKSIDHLLEAPGSAAWSAKTGKFKIIGGPVARKPGRIGGNRILIGGILDGGPKALASSAVRHVEMATAESVNNWGGAVGFGLAGAALFGPAGLIVGGLMGGKGTSHVFIAVLSDDTRLLIEGDTGAYRAFLAAAIH